MKLENLKNIGNAKYVETIDINGICVGDHKQSDYPQTRWESTAETDDGKKVIITYITTPEDKRTAEEHGWDIIDWDSKITKIELTEEDK